MARRRPMSLPRRIGLLLERTTTQKGRAMTKILAGITTSVDGFIAGPDDGPGEGLGAGGERLHYWGFGGGRGKGPGGGGGALVLGVVGGAGEERRGPRGGPAGGGRGGARRCDRADRRGRRRPEHV